jgi:hypothetical protein
MTRAEALTSIRESLRDSTSDPQFSDTFLANAVEIALNEIATHTRNVDPHYYFTYEVRNAYTDALDGARYEMYGLPATMSALLWIERADLSVKQKLRQVTPYEQEAARFGGAPMYGTFSIDGSTSYGFPSNQAIETYAVLGDRFRILPAPTAAGAQYGIAFLRRPRFPAGTSDLVDVSGPFERALVLSAAWRAAEKDGEHDIASAVKRELYGDPEFPGQVGEIARARDEHTRRARRNIFIGG